MEFNEIARLIKQATMGTYHNMPRVEQKALQKELSSIQWKLTQAFRKADTQTITFLLDSLSVLPRHQVAKKATNQLYDLVF